MLTSEIQVTNLTDEEFKALYEECGGDPQRIASHLGVTLPNISPFAPFNPRRRQPPENIGNPKLKHRIVSIRHSMTDWPLADLEKINRARKLYDDGTHEICQGREGDWFILYCIPRKVRTSPRKYFSTLETPGDR